MGKLCAVGADGVIKADGHRGEGVRSLHLPVGAVIEDGEKNPIFLANHQSN